MVARYVISDVQPETADALDQIGGKAGNLCRIKRYLPVPEFFVITTTTFRTALDAQHPAGCCEHLLDRFAQGCEDDVREAAGELREMIRRLEWPSEIVAAIQTAHFDYFGDQRAVAVRSSAVGEDSTRHSFAGIYESILDVRGAADVLEAVKQVWASCFSDRVIAYRLRHGLHVRDAGLAVIIQEMVVARQSGVLFTCNPSSGDSREIVIDAVPGNSHELVQGQVNAESHRVRKVDLEILPNRRANETDVGRVEQGTDKSVLSAEQVIAAAQAGLVLERLFQSHQDVEFCFDQNGELLILQSRPVTVAGATARDHMVWDNSNIIESYAGVTTPLTFSFIRRAYTIVYTCFAEVMGISPRVVNAHGGTFENMLGFFRGRVYYNLKNWYRLVRLFPGYQYNCGFMESMMGLKEPLCLDEKQPPAGFLRRWFVELPALLLLVARIVWKFLRIESIVRRFEEHFDAHYEHWRTIDFRRQPPHELLSLYRQMEAALLWNWKAPIINDFYVMVFYGLLKKLCTQWCSDSTGSLQNGLLCGVGDLASAEPARCLLELARVASRDGLLRDAILHEPAASLSSRVAADPQFEPFHTLLKRYLDEYGLRCENELKLEAYSHRDRPERVFELIRGYLQLENQSVLDESLRAEREQARRLETEHAAFSAIAASSSWVPRKWVFRSVLHNARWGIQQREKMRLARTKIYGVARSMFRALGEQFAEAGALDAADDIFYLTTDEVWGFVQGTAVATDLSGLVALRRREFDAYCSAEVPKPGRRFETRGIAYLDNDLRGSTDERERNDGAIMQGVGCCPGVVEGTVQIVVAAADRREFVGDILVASQTDPGWVPLFPAFRGMLIERGSVLSHSAIVAREMGIPTIVAVPGLLDRLQNGQHVRLDGANGVVEILMPIAPADDDPSTPTSATSSDDKR